MNHLNKSFAALSDETRLTIVEQLMKSGELPAGDLASGFDISAPAISRHLKVLRQAGLIEQRIDGTHRLYSVRPDALQAIANWVVDHRAFWQGGLDRLDTLLALDPDEEDTE